MEEPVVDVSAAERQAEAEEADRLRKEKAMRSMEYLLQVSDAYSNFWRDKLDQKESQKNKHSYKNKLIPSLQDLRADIKNPVQKIPMLTDDQLDKELKYFTGILRPYQREGVKWLLQLFENGLNGILADEMGLGKTIQVIALLCILYNRGIKEPILLIVPLSTLPNWMSEFKKFADTIPVVQFYGNKFERDEISRQLKRTRYYFDKKRAHPVVITSYEIPLKESRFFSTFTWSFIIVDEGHRLKNHNSSLGITLRNFQSENRILLTGTPLQNSMLELWSLLNFIMPHIFRDMEAFTMILEMDDVAHCDRLIEWEKSESYVSTIHRVLQTFMLRRLKVDVMDDIVPKKELEVYCPMTPLQMELYSYVLQKNIGKLVNMTKEDKEVAEPPLKKRKCVQKRSNYFAKLYKWESVGHLDAFEELEKETDEGLEKATQNLGKCCVKYLNSITMQNSLIMLRKIVNHPYLVHFPLDPNSKEKKLFINEDLVNCSGKMLVLDMMLKKLKEDGHKVLLFSTLVIMLDLIEDFVIMRGYNYERLDGRTKMEYRWDSINSFNNNDDSFLFLLSTRAGGMGLNLTGADTIIFFDRDWNPQIDIQAQARCHRIGQTKPVVTYTLVTKNTVDEKIIMCGNLKRKLETVVMVANTKFKKGEVKNKEKVTSLVESLQELVKMIETGPLKIHSNGFVYSDNEMNKLLDRSELIAQMVERQKNSV